jgi:hypothetical protein
MWERGIARAAAQPPRDAALLANGVKFARVAKNDLRSIGCWKTQQARRLRQLLGRSYRQQAARDWKQENEKSGEDAHSKEEQSHQAAAE